MAEQGPVLGKLVEGEAGRDAIHIAVFAAVAKYDLSPGERVAITDGNQAYSVEANSLNYVGIVDPYLAAKVKKGERFWLCLYPNTTTSLRHVWTHPAFPVESATPAPEASAERQESEAWLRDFANRCAATCENWGGGSREDRWRTVTYEDVVHAGRHFIHTSEPFIQMGSEDARDLIWDGDTRSLYWKHWQAVTGEKAPPDVLEEHPFSCSC